uniref:Gfo/Idh/MocA family oxidoreductase n=1 Tax=Ignisphaera aggregans TaxID=334771 RepID=A0A7J3Z7T4_9CREN
MLKVGVVGVGNMGFHHTRIYSELTEKGLVELAGIADINYERALRVAKTFKTRAFKDYKELIRLVDAVSIATPTETHRDIALEFINAEKHVLVEKPIASNVKEAQELVKKAEEKHVVLMMGHVERYNPAVVKLREIVKNNLLGEIVTITARRVGPFNPRVAKTSIIVDLAIHDIDVINSLLDFHVLSVYARSRRVHPNSLEDDYGLITLSYENQVDAVIETNRLTPYKMRTLEVVGSKGIAILNYLEQKITIYDEEWIREAIIQKEEPLKLELLNFIRVLQGVDKPVVTKEQALYALLISEAALESSRRNKLILIKDFVVEKNYKIAL